MPSTALLPRRPVFHLTHRVAWHDTRWNGAVCGTPSTNSFCTMLDRIREEKTDEEDKLRGRAWDTLGFDELPPCKAEGGAFMSPTPWHRRFVHPYSDNKHCRETHGKLRPRIIEVPAWTAVAVPFRWMLRANQDALDERLPQALASDEDAPFPTPWVFGAKRQRAVLEHIFNKVEKNRSLIFFYTKEGQPVDDHLNRLIVGVGEVTHCGKVEEYDSDGGDAHPLWDRLVSHSIRPDGERGFLLPYHEYLASTGDDAEDARRRELLREIAVGAPDGHVSVFSYGSEIAGPAAALGALTRLLQAVRLVREHGIAAGPWQERERWLNDQIHNAWLDRGAFPGTGAALEALGLRTGTSLFLELRANGELEATDDPWPLLDKIIRGKTKPPQKAYITDIKELAPTWNGLSAERRRVLELFSRFDLTPVQAARLFDEKDRRDSLDGVVKDAELLANPYLLVERDLGMGADDPLVTLGVVDWGLLPDQALAGAPPVPEPSAVRAPEDERRLRAALVSVLRAASDSGDCLLSFTEAQTRLAALDAATPVEISPDWLRGRTSFLSEVIVITEQASATDADAFTALQLVKLKGWEDRLRKVLLARAAKEIPGVKEDWAKRIQECLKRSGHRFDPKVQRHHDALTEQVKALDGLTRRRLTVLVGGAGTGKTSVMGALVASKELATEGLLLLAPTGKASVRLTQAAESESAQTIAAFLNSLKRYDGRRQRPRLEGKERYAGARTVVIDEASMLTEDTLLALLEALDLSHVQRLILVGDPNQLPPIGAGRPFADLIAHLESLALSKSAEALHLNGALCRLSVEVRSQAGNIDTRSNTLRLAAWFTNRGPSPDDERLVCELRPGLAMGDLELDCWQTPEELRKLIRAKFNTHLGITDDPKTFDAALGFTTEGWVNFADPDGIGNFQLLTPVRAHPFGVREINRWVQHTWRASQIRGAREFYDVALGDEEIVKKDKVIQLVNQTRKGWDWSEGESVEAYLANGEIGVAGPSKLKGTLNVVFAGRGGNTFTYEKKNFGKERAAPLELAYALTIHKSQGSQFDTVIVILPRNITSRFLSRELIYTALTRSRKKLVLLVEGTGTGLLQELSKPERSDTLRRNTALFTSVVRSAPDQPPHAEHLIHTTRKGHLVRSKSEFIIANLLFENSISYDYEKRLDSIVPERAPGWIWPDFSFEDAAGDRLIWEHLGMCGTKDYDDGWLWKQQWYEANGYVEGKNLFITREFTGQGIADSEFTSMVKKIGSLI